MLHLYKLGWYSWIVGFYYSAYMCKLYMRVEKHAIPSVNKALVKTPTFNVIVILSRKYMFKVLGHMPSSWSLLKSQRRRLNFISIPKLLNRTTYYSIDFVGTFLAQMFCWQMHVGNIIKFTEKLFYSITTTIHLYKAEIPVVSNKGWQSCVTNFGNGWLQFQPFHQPVLKCTVPK